MSTVVVAKKDGWVAIGADTLCTLGSTRESAEYIENPSKLMRVGENVIGVVGHASWQLVLASYFASRPELPELNSVQAIFEAARELHRVLKDDYFLKADEDEDDEFESTRLDCLIANRWGIFGMYSLRSVQEYRKFYAFGSGYKYALGAMRSAYDLSPSAEMVAQAGLEASADFDDGTGLPVEVLAIRMQR